MYTNLARVRKYLDLASPDTSDDLELISYIKRASRSIDTYCMRSFMPSSETRFYNYDKPRSVRLDADLVSLTTLKTQNGACTVASGVLWLQCGDSWNYRPYDNIVLDDNSGSVLNYSGTPQRANEVTGVWGYHEDWTNAWVDVGTSLTEGVDASSRIISLAGAGSFGANASDVRYEHPRVAIGDLLKIEDGDGSYEWVQVSAEGSTANLAVVERGMYGTSGTSHGSAASITRYTPEPDIEWSAVRLVSWRHGQKSTPYETRKFNPIVGQIEVPDTWPLDVKAILDRFRRSRIWAS